MKPVTEPITEQTRITGRLYGRFADVLDDKAAEQQAFEIMSSVKGHDKLAKIFLVEDICRECRNGFGRKNADLDTPLCRYLQCNENPVLVWGLAIRTCTRISLTLAVRIDKLGFCQGEHQKIIKKYLNRYRNRIIRLIDSLNRIHIETKYDNNRF